MRAATRVGRRRRSGPRDVGGHGLRFFPAVSRFGALTTPSVWETSITTPPPPLPPAGQKKKKKLPPLSDAYVAQRRPRAGAKRRWPAPPAEEESACGSLNPAFAYPKHRWGGRRARATKSSPTQSRRGVSSLFICWRIHVSTVATMPKKKVQIYCIKCEKYYRVCNLMGDHKKTCI